MRLNTSELTTAVTQAETEQQAKWKHIQRSRTLRREDVDQQLILLTRMHAALPKGTGHNELKKMMSYHGTHLKRGEKQKTEVLLSAPLNDDHAGGPQVCLLTRQSRSAQMLKDGHGFMLLPLHTPGDVITDQRQLPDLHDLHALGFASSSALSTRTLLDLEPVRFFLDRSMLAYDLIFRAIPVLVLVELVGIMNTNQAHNPAFRLLANRFGTETEFMVLVFSVLFALSFVVTYPVNRFLLRRNVRSAMLE